jgi:hypothetical protein
MYLNHRKRSQLLHEGKDNPQHCFLDMPTLAGCSQWLPVKDAGRATGEKSVACLPISLAGYDRNAIFRPRGSGGGGIPNTHDRVADVVLFDVAATTGAGSAKRRSCRAISTTHETGIDRVSDLGLARSAEPPFVVNHACAQLYFMLKTFMLEINRKTR